MLLGGSPRGNARAIEKNLQAMGLTRREARTIISRYREAEKNSFSQPDPRKLNQAQRSH